MSEQRKKLAIIDGKSVFYRGYYATPNLATKDGTPTGGVFGFAVMALEVIKRLNPDYVCVAWDKPKTNIRKRLELYPQYKAGRKPAPPDFYAQIPYLHELLEAFGWPLYELDDYEADDIMGTLAIQAAKKDIETMLITSDLDMLQLVDPHIRVFALKKGLSNIELYSPDSFEAKYGIKATQFLDLKALKGDSSDNIPGVPGIGEKGALELLKNYKTLDGVYENIDLISGSANKKLVAGKELAYLSKKLAQIWTDAPIKLDLKEVDGSKCDPNRVHDVLQKLEFRSLVRQLPEVMKVSPAVQESSVGKSLKGTMDLKIISVDTELAKISFKESNNVAMFSRARGKHGRKPEWLYLSPDPHSVYALDLAKLDHKKVVELIEKSELEAIGHDIKGTLQVLIEIGVKKLPKIYHDTLIAAFLLDAIRREQNLHELADVDLNVSLTNPDDVSTEELNDHVADIFKVIWALSEKQMQALAAIPKLEKLARDIELPVISVLAEMEHTGIYLDSKYLSKFSEELRDQISDLEQQIYGHADQEFNISSPIQLSQVLFEKLNLPTQGIKKGKNGYSTAAAELDKLRPLHPMVELITQYREVTKLMSTYVEALPKQVDEKGRLHTTYNMATAPTGRLSSVDPNLQNIPVRTELGNRIRTAFVAAPGNLLISTDYSQFELRLAAVLAGDEGLIDMFNRDIDIHTATAAQVYGREPEDVTKTMRRDAKVINFGILYGMSPHGLSAATGMTFEAAKQFIDKYFELRKPLLDYMNSLKEVARTQGYVETMFGRRRPMPDIHASNFIVRQAAERAAINMPIQGTEADLMKLAMIRVQEYLEAKKGSDMLLQIHDSILIEAPQDEAEEIARDVKDIMEKVYELPVKLTVDTSVGQNWGDL